jgi:DNA-binding transcriptional MerR regulator
VVRYSGFSRQTIHNYTTMGLITERERTAGGHRMYGEDAFRALAVIKSLKGRKTLSEIREVLAARGMLDDPGATDSPSADATL